MKKTITKIIALFLILAVSVLPMLLSCDAEKKDVYYVRMSFKDYGDIVLELDRKSAPITVDNFVGLVNDGFYNGLTIHRAQAGFVIQGGDPEGTGSGGSGKTIKGEFFANGYYGNNISHVRGVISMARRGDSYDSATSQFFICLGDCRSSLDGSYAGFGYVIEGMDVVDAIAEDMAPYGNSMGSVSDKTKHAVITEAVVINR